MISVLSQILSIRSCLSLLSFIQSGPTRRETSCERQTPPTVFTKDTPIMQMTRPVTETGSETKDRPNQVRPHYTRLRPQTHYCPTRQSTAGGGRVTCLRRQSFSTTSRCSVRSSTCSCAQTPVSSPPLPPWSGGRSQDTNTLSQSDTAAAFTREKCPTWRTHLSPSATVTGWYVSPDPEDDK